MKEIHGSIGFWRRGNEVVFSSLLAPSRNFAEMKFLLFDYFRMEKEQKSFSR
jgi:hypothetical protein